MPIIPHKTLIQNFQKVSPMVAVDYAEFFIFDTTQRGLFGHRRTDSKLELAVDLAVESAVDSAVDEG